MATTQPVGQQRLLHERIQEHGLRAGEYALFFVTGEGRFLPTSSPTEEVEEASGFVLDRRGRVYSFWFGWDPERQHPTMVAWKEVQSEPDWHEDVEYQEARAQLGLPPAA